MMACHKTPTYVLGWLLVMLLIFGIFGQVNAVPSADAVKPAIKTLLSRDIISPSTNELMVNTIGFGVFALICFTMRLFSRAWVLKSWHLDDTLMCLTFFFYIALLVLINVSAGFSTNLYPPESAAAIFANPDDVASRVLGSKIVIPLEQCMMVTTWGVKFCIWYFLLRVNKSTQWEKGLWFLFGYLWISFIIIEILYYGVFCRPFSQYWAMPVENSECATYHNYSIVQMVFNISSDVWLVASPMPLVHNARLPIKRKIVLVSLFALAFITIIFAILNKYYNFASPQTTVYQLWYIREASVAVAVGNLICSWQLIQKLFKLRSFDDKEAGIEPLPQSPNLLSNAVGKGFKAVRQRVRSLYEITDLESTAIGRTQPRTGRSSEKTAYDSTMTSQSMLEPGTPHFSEDSKPKPLASHPIITAKDPNKFTSFINLSRRKYRGQHPQISQPTHLMSIARDGDDAGLALAYRDQNEIV